MKNFKSTAIPFKVYALFYSALIKQIGITFLEQHLDVIYTQCTKFRVSGSFHLTIN